MSNLIERCIALASRVLAAVALKQGEGAVYNDVTRAVVLTPVGDDGQPYWRTKADSGTARDRVVRVFAAATKDGKVSVHIGGHAWPTKGKREWSTAGPFDAAAAEKVIAATLARLFSGKYDSGLASHVPQAMQATRGYVQRPDTLGRGSKVATVATVDVDADAALLAPPADIAPPATDAPVAPPATVDAPPATVDAPPATAAPVARQRR